jgi:hypothetical protein
VLFCGVFGNITAADTEATVRALPAFCAPGATVIWTRGRHTPDIRQDIRAWFTDAGFEELTFDAPDGVVWSVGSNRYLAAEAPPAPNRLFTFRSYLT